MKNLVFAVLCAACYFILASGVAYSEPEQDDFASLPSTLVAPAVIESRLAEVEASSSLEEQVKSRLLEYYRKALSNLQTADSHAERAASFEQAAESAPEAIGAPRREQEAAGFPAIEEQTELSPSTPVQQLEQILQKEKADLAAAEASLADIENRLRETEGRPTLIAQRFSEAKRKQEETSVQLKLPPAADEGPKSSEARRWVLETRYHALSVEIAALDRELLSQPIRVDLLEARRDSALSDAERADKRVRALEDMIARKRQEEADQALADAEMARIQAEGKHPLVVQLAEQNAVLSEEIAAMASPMKALTEQAEQVKDLARQIEDDYNSARESIEIGGLSQELGHMLLQRSQSLPDPRLIRRQVEEREKKAAEIGVRRLRHRENAKPLRNLNDYVDRVAVEAEGRDTPLLRAQLRDLGSNRKALLEQAIESDDVYLRMLGELESAQGRLLMAVGAFDGFLDQNLLWIRSASRTELEELGALPEQLWRIFSPAGWYEVTRTLAYQATHSPVFGLLILALLALLLNRRRLVGMIEAVGRKAGDPATDRFSYSINTLMLTLMIAATWPLVVAVFGWQLRASPVTTEFSNAAGESLRIVAIQFFYIRAFWWICIPGGLASAHFHWAEQGLEVRRITLNRMAWIYLPALTVTSLAFYLDPLNAGWVVGRAAFVVMVASVAYTLYRILSPTRGVLAGYIRQPEHRTFQRFHRLLYPVVVAAPLALGVLSLMGYVYTAGIFLVMLLQTGWMVVGLVMLSALAERWLGMTRRRLAFEAEMERHAAMLEEQQGQGKAYVGEEAGLPEIEEPEVDLDTLSDTTRELLLTVVFALGLVGLWFIWSEVFPAFAILNDVTLWHYTDMVDGEARLVPVTLANIGLALIYGVSAIVLARKLPSVMEIILMEYFDMPSGSRYAVTTLTTYTIVAVGIFLVLSTVGAQWSKLQWLIAALSVGIGFGLQEIVANFISGIIILFERPIRVGDFVSIGDTDGVVTKIRIRATTIRNRENKELLVPNKEFITGRLLNWSLSDQTIKVVVVVGVAYGSDVDKALELMKQSAVENEHVLNDPAAVVSFEGFGDNALTLLLRATISSVDHRVTTITALHKAINRKFMKAGISIAFPQRDLHLNTQGPLRIAIETDARRPVVSTDKD
jgi:potassium efflux system protein